LQNNRIEVVIFLSEEVIFVDWKLDVEVFVFAGCMHNHSGRPTYESDEETD
jgi:hypothetical protein